MPKPISKLLSLGDGKRLRRYRSIVDKVNSLENGLSALADAELRASPTACASAPRPARRTRSFFPSHSPSCAKQRSAPWGFAITTCSSSAAWP